MNKGIILDYISKKNKKEVIEDKEIQDLINDIKQTKLEIDAAREMFNFVSDPKLIEAAIYKEEAAIKRYEYLISLAKSRKITSSIE